MKQSTKKYLALTAAALMAVLMLAGCGSQSAQTAQQQTSQTAADKVSVVDTWYYSGKTDASYLVLKADGTVESHQAGGKLLASGTYTYDGTTVQIILTTTAGKKEHKPDAFQLTDRNTLYFEKEDRTYLRSSAAEEQKKAETEKEAAIRAEQAKQDQPGEGKQPLSSAKLTAAKVVGSWWYQGDKTKGTLEIGKDGSFSTTDKAGKKAFDGTYKLNDSQIDIYDSTQTYVQSMRMQENGQLTENGGATSYIRSGK